MFAPYSQPYSAERDFLVGDEIDTVDDCDAEGEERNIHARPHYQPAPPRLPCHSFIRLCQIFLKFSNKTVLNPYKY